MPYLEFPAQRPTKADLIMDEAAATRLTGFLIKNYVDQVSAQQVGRQCRVQFHFDH